MPGVQRRFQQFRHEIPPQSSSQTGADSVCRKSSNVQAYEGKRIAYSWQEYKASCSGAAGEKAFRQFFGVQCGNAKDFWPVSGREEIVFRQSLRAAFKKASFPAALPERAEARSGAGAAAASVHFATLFFTGKGRLAQKAVGVGSSYADCSGSISSFCSSSP